MGGLGVVAGFSLVLGLQACVRDDKWPGFHGDDDTGSPPDYPEDTDPGDTDTGAGGPDDSSDTDPDDTDTDDTGNPDPDPVGTGWDVGDVAYDLLATDDSGTPWSLYDHDRGPVLLVFGYAQSYNFQALCGYLPGLDDDYGDRGLTIAAALVQDDAFVTADQDDAADWATEYDLGTVLWDSEGEFVPDWVAMSQVKTWLLSRDMVIEWVGVEAVTESVLQMEVGDLLE